MSVYVNAEKVGHYLDEILSDHTASDESKKLVISESYIVAIKEVLVKKLLEGERSHLWKKLGAKGKKALLMQLLSDSADDTNCIDEVIGVRKRHLQREKDIKIFDMAGSRTFLTAMVLFGVAFTLLVVGIIPSFSVWMAAVAGLAVCSLSVGAWSFSGDNKLSENEEQEDGVLKALESLRGFCVGKRAENDKLLDPAVGDSIGFQDPASLSSQIGEFLAYRGDADLDADWLLSDNEESDVAVEGERSHESGARSPLMDNTMFASETEDNASVAGGLSLLSSPPKPF